MEEVERIVAFMQLVGYLTLNIFPILARIFSATDAYYPATGIQPFEGEPASN